MTSLATNTGAQKTSGQTNPRARLHQDDADLCAGRRLSVPLFHPSGWSQATMETNPISTLLQRFACARLSQPCLSESSPDLSAMFTIIAFDNSSLRRLEIRRNAVWTGDSRDTRPTAVFGFAVCTNWPVGKCLAYPPD